MESVILIQYKCIHVFITVYYSKISQISMNIIDSDVTSLVQVWEEVNRRAKLYNLPLCGSEIVGVLPLKALLDVADYYIKQENLLLLDEELKIQFVISRLGLSFLNEFKAREKIIEYILEDQNKDKDKKLIDLTVKSFIDEVRNRNVVPGGGSVSALDKDSEAYSKIVFASRLAEINDNDKLHKQQCYRIAILNAINVPRQLMDEVIELMNSIEKLCPIINMNAISDLQVAISCFRVAVTGASYNVLINLESLSWDDELKQKIESDTKNKNRIAEHLERRLLALLALNPVEQ